MAVAVTPVVEVVLRQHRISPGAGSGCKSDQTYTEVVVNADVVSTVDVTVTVVGNAATVTV